MFSISVNIWAISLGDVLAVLDLDRGVLAERPGQLVLGGVGGAAGRLQHDLHVGDAVGDVRVQGRGVEHDPRIISLPS